jgi:hypothetical protein
MYCALDPLGYLGTADCAIDPFAGDGPAPGVVGGLLAARPHGRRVSAVPPAARMTWSRAVPRAMMMVPPMARQQARPPRRYTRRNALDSQPVRLAYRPWS